MERVCEGGKLVLRISLTEYNVAWTTKKLIQYGKQVGIVDIETWSFVWTPAEWNRSKFKGYHNAYSWWGICSIERKAILINIRQHHCLKCKYTKIDGDRTSVEWTVVHEIVHARFPNLRHGKIFHARILKILNGKRYLEAR